MRPIVMTPEVIAAACERLALQMKGQHTFKDKIDVSVAVNTKLTDDQKPTVFIKLRAYQKIMELVAQSTVEIAWHGTVERDETTNTFMITDIYVFPQSVTGVTAVSIDALYGPWLMSFPNEVFNKLRMHGHSHVNMSVTPSAVDINYQETLIDKVEDYYIFLIVNKSAKCHATIFDVVNNTVYTDEDILIDSEIDPVNAWARHQISKHIDAHKPKLPANTTTFPAKPPIDFDIKDLPFECKKVYTAGFYYNRALELYIPDQYHLFTLDQLRALAAEKKSNTSEGRRRGRPTVERVPEVPERKNKKDGRRKRTGRYSEIIP